MTTICMQQTSLNTYKDITYRGITGKQEQEVYDFIFKNPRCTRAEIERGLAMRISSVCGRVNKLVKSGFVVELGSKKDQSGNFGRELMAR